MCFTKKYFQIIAQNFNIANACTIKHGVLPFKLQAVGIEHYLPIPSQFLYLLLLTRTIPFLAKKHRQKKSFRFGAVKRETAKIMAYPNQARLNVIFNKFMGQLAPVQLPPEPSAIKFEKNYVRIIV